MAQDSYRHTAQPQYFSRVYAGELLCGSTLYGEKDGNAIRQSSMP